MTFRRYMSARRIRPAVALLVGALLGACAGCGGSTATIASTANGAGPGSDSIVPEAVLPTVRCGDYFIAEAELNGRGPFHLMLDTGFPRTQLSTDAAAALGLRRSVGAIDLGGLRVRGRIPVGVRDLSTISHALGFEIDGILGYTVFEDLLLTYDYRAGAVRVAEGTLREGAAGTMAMSRGDRPFVRARMGTRTVELLLDTGFSGGVGLVDFAELPFEGEARIVGARVRVDGVSRRWGGRLAEDLELDAFTLRRPVVADAPRRNLLGQDVLRQFVVTLDRASGRARFEPVEGAASAPRVIELPPMRATGLILVPRADHYLVADVLERSSAAGAGLLPGDRVVAIDGVPVAERGCADPEGDDAGAPRVLTVEREGERFEVVVVTEVVVG